MYLYGKNLAKIILEPLAQILRSVGKENHIIYYKNEKALLKMTQSNTS